MPFGRYRLIELLGRGGMGGVLCPRHGDTHNRTVAIDCYRRSCLPNTVRSVAKIRQESCKTSAATFAMTGHDDGQQRRTPIITYPPG